MNLIITGGKGSWFGENRGGKEGGKEEGGRMWWGGGTE